VTYQDIMAAYRESDRPFLPIPMGVGERDEISWLHLAQYPHFLVAGTTGGGKSNMINVIITTLISKHGPNEVQFVLVDLKEGLEFQHYADIPHLMRPVVTTIQGAAEVMLQLEQLRAERGKLLAAARVKDIDEYNDVMERRKQKQMPRIVVIFDEYAAIDNPFSQDLKKSIQASAMQLTNKARAAGIHLILCTQRPSVDVVPGHIKDNMAFRIAGAMPTQAASTTILGVGDAATLPLIRGRMIAMAGSLKWQLQTPHIKQVDIENGVRIAKKWAEKLTAGEMEKETLPAAIGSIGFGEDDLMHLVMDDYGGQMNLSELWNQLKDTGLVSHNELHAMGKKLKQLPEFEYEGVRYRWAKQPGNKVVAMPLEESQTKQLTG
jgi:S-DNA-T family DNA segregation ATPase FtsK/SpoIIIE